MSSDYKTENGGGGEDTFRYDEGEAVADRLDDFDDPDAREDADDVFAEFDATFSDN